MSNEAQICLVDADIRRRATISHCLAKGGFHVEPVESVTELSGRWPRTGVILAHDGDGSLARLIQQMGEAGNWLPVLAYGEAPQPAEVVEAILAGAIDYLAWPFDLPAITAAIAVTTKRADRLGTARQREAVARCRVERLTRREREVLSGVAAGLSNRLIGERLAISPRTVEIHRANMLNKMGAQHTSEAIRFAIEASLLA